MAILVFSPNGTYVAKPTLEAARTSADCAGKTVVVTSALTAAQSDITAAWPADRALEVKKGGSIGNTTAFTINGPFSAGSYQAFTGTGAITGLAYAEPQWFYSGIGTWNTAFQAAVNASSEVYVPPGTYQMSAAFINLQSGNHIYGNSRTSILAATVSITGDGGNNQGQIFDCKYLDNVHIDNLYFKGGGYAFGAVSFGGCTNSSIKNCDIENITSQAIQIAKLGIANGDNIVVESNRIYIAQHGIQLWMASGVIVVNNSVERVSGGGIWGALPYHTIISNNVVKDCGDVGIDIEGGLDVLVSSNIVSRCAHGELSLFTDAVGTNGCYNILFTGNTLAREAQYTDVAGVAQNTPVSFGAIWIASIGRTADFGANGNIVFSGNSIWVKHSGSAAIYTHDGTSAYSGLSFLNNKIICDLGSFFRLNGLGKLIISGNVFESNVSADTSMNEWKNPHGHIFSYNIFTYTVTKASGAAVYYLTSAAVTGRPEFMYNTFRGAGDYAFMHDPWASGTSALLKGNKLTDGYTTNGGLVTTANGAPVYADQQLLIALVEGNNDLAAISPLMGRTGSVFHVFQGTLNVAMGGVFGGSYIVAGQLANGSGKVVSRDGTGSGSGFGADIGRYAAFATSVITIVDVDATLPSTGYLAITLNSSGF